MTNKHIISLLLPFKPSQNTDWGIIYIFLSPLDTIKWHKHNILGPLTIFWIGISSPFNLLQKLTKKKQWRKIPMCVLVLNLPKGLVNFPEVLLTRVVDRYVPLIRNLWAEIVLDVIMWIFAWMVTFAIIFSHNTMLKKYFILVSLFAVENFAWEKKLNKIYFLW